MNPKDSRRFLAQVFADAVRAYQTRDIIPHCRVCTRPCCGLDPLVLELEWKQIKVFWRVEESRAAFDKRLNAGQGPQEIRAANGLYYAHGKPCPAFDQGAGLCTVYDQPLKPQGCSDFPVYEDGDCLVADLRCEAVDLKALSSEVSQRLGADYRLVSTPDADFPFLVTLSVKPAQRRKPRPAR